MFTQRILIDPGFNFRATVESHGWYQLPPFQYHPEHGVLSRVHQMPDGRIVRIHVEQSGNTSRETFLLVQTEGDVFATDHAVIDAIVRRMLCLDWDLGDFYALTRSLPDYGWVDRAGAGRLLRAPSVWEDLVKTLLTTNTTWSQTINMVRKLVTLGGDSPFGHAFPTPQQVAVRDVAALTAHVSCGYRGPYLHTLAAQVASGELNVEQWSEPGIDSQTLHKQIKSLKGFGDYAVASVLRLLGHHDVLSIDTVCRDMFARKHHNGEKPTDAVIRAHYEPYGKWRGLIMWMDVIREDFA